MEDRLILAILLSALMIIGAAFFGLAVIRKRREDRRIRRSRYRLGRRG